MKKLNKIINNIRYRLIGNIWNEIKNLPYNIKNIIRWIPVLWNNFDWDSEYLLDIMRFKLSRMEKYFRNDAIIADNEEIAKKISSAIYFIDKLCDGVYEDEAYKKYYDEYPNGTGFYETEIGGKRHFFLKPMTQEQRKLFHECTDECDRFNRYYKEQLFKTLSEFQNWWD